MLTRQCLIQCSYKKNPRGLALCLLKKKGSPRRCEEIYFNNENNYSLEDKRNMMILLVVCWRAMSHWISPQSLLPRLLYSFNCTID